MMKTLPFDVAEHLTAADAQAELLAEAYGNGDDNFIDAALDAVIRARKLHRPNNASTSVAARTEK